MNIKKVKRCSKVAEHNWDRPTDHYSPPGWDISPSQGYPPSISSGFPDDPLVPIYTPERREERALPKNKTQWPGQVLNSGLSTWSLAHWPLGTCLLGGVGGGGLERGEAETGSVNKPAVKFGLEIEPLGHSDAMGEGGSSDNVLSILHHKFSSWSWGGKGDFGCFKSKVYLILPEALEYS